MVLPIGLEAGGGAISAAYTEKGFLLYVAGRRDELRIRGPTDSERRMRRFLRDYAKSRGGLPHNVSLRTTPWR